MIDSAFNENLRGARSGDIRGVERTYSATT